MVGSMRLILAPALLAICVCQASQCPDFYRMRVRALRDYLAERNVKCIGCTEKNEYISKALKACAETLVTEKRKPQTKPRPTSRPKPRPQSHMVGSNARSMPNSDLAYGISCMAFLFMTVVLRLYKCCSPLSRQIIYKLKDKSEDDICPITMEPIKDPFKTHCCGNVCERQAMAQLAQKSNLFRLKRRESLMGTRNVQRVVQCPICRCVQEPFTVRKLLGDYALPAPVDANICLDSGISDPAWLRGDADNENFIRLKAWDDIVGDSAELVRVRPEDPEELEDSDANSTDEEPEVK